jgi:isopentenyl phosphate kinase
MHKVEESLELAKKGISSLIISGISEKNLLKKALLGKKVTGTSIG